MTTDPKPSIVFSGTAADKIVKLPREAKQDIVDSLTKRLGALENRGAESGPPAGVAQIKNTAYLAVNATQGKVAVVRKMAPEESTDRLKVLKGQEHFLVADFVDEHDL